MQERHTGGLPDLTLAFQAYKCYFNQVNPNEVGTACGGPRPGVQGGITGVL